MKKKIIETMPEHYKIVKSVIYKLYDEDDSSVTPLYFTLNALRNHTINVLWDEWDGLHPEEQELTKEDLYDSDENLFAYLENWRYNVGRIIYIDVK